MHWIDWTVLVSLMTWIVYDGLRRTKDSQELDGYFLAKRSIPWWAAGISVMATQLSAITMIGTTGQGYTDGMRFIQFYFGLPLAMVVLSVTLVPFFYNSGVYTAYEYLERRFDAKTRALTSLLFLLSRGMSCGAVVAAPAVVLSLVLDLNVTSTALLIAAPAVVYTMFGGVQAVTWTDVKIMVLIVFGLFAVIAAADCRLSRWRGPGRRPEHRRRHGPAPHVRLQLRPHEPIHVLVRHDRGVLSVLLLLRHRPEPGAAVPHGQVGGRSATLAADERLLEDSAPGAGAAARCAGVRVLRVQSAASHLQQHRYGAAERRGECSLCSAAAGAWGGRGPPAGGRDRAGAGAGAVRMRPEQTVARERVREESAALDQVRRRARELVRSSTGDAAFDDVNYVIPTFILEQLPVGLVGLLILAILLAATDTIAGELNSLSTATVIDFYRRWARPVATDAHYLGVSKAATALWGVFACLVAVWAAELGSLIEVVNRIGSFFYGSLLGVFILAVGFPRATGNGACVGLVAGMASVAAAAAFTPVAFLWHNVIGAVVVVAVGLVVSEAERAMGRGLRVCCLCRP